MLPLDLTVPEEVAVPAPLLGGLVPPCGRPAFLCAEEVPAPALVAVPLQLALPTLFPSLQCTDLTPLTTSVVQLPPLVPVEALI